ncbi:hypothetical protein Pmani_005121 [Petrolisthes manimaculis]|uniref:PiggyBac transposable element-derived protein domain-containing protein n=1 Tax=Petrolisthes manimaculis TaxID=1843537 RepID=A0AAE1QDF3_9EUCA|nr:hypothetical protein Pmani_005121 [Petrolisthes manimaculis]
MHRSEKLRREQIEEMLLQTTADLIGESEGSTDSDTGNEVATTPVVRARLAAEAESDLHPPPPHTSPSGSGQQEIVIDLEHAEILNVSTVHSLITHTTPSHNTFTPNDSPAAKRRIIHSSDSEEVDDVPEVDATSPIIDTEESESQLDPHDSDSDLDYEPLPMSQSETEEEEGSQETTTTQQSPTPQSPTPPTPQSPTPQQSTTTEAETNKYIHKLTSSDRRAPDKTLWSRKSLPPKPPQQAPQNYEKGLATNEAKNAVTPGDFLSLIIDDDMINIIVTCTNRMIEKKARKYKTEGFVHKTSYTEIKALIGILILSGSKHDNHHTTLEMFSTHHGAPIYRFVCSRNRFTFLLDCLRFDNIETRAERQATDKFAPFRDIFERFVSNSTKHYTPGNKLTIDEQLLSFRGRCPFKMYMPMKPAKYGLKIVMICDAENYYMCNAKTYLGKETVGRGRNVNIAQEITMTLMKPFLDTGRNLTMDNWFTSLPLTRQLYDRNTTCVGTIRRKGYIPMAMLGKSKQRKVNTSAFLFQENVTLLSYKAKKKKTVMLMSSLHNEVKIGDKGKAEIIHYYNKTKCGVDVLDQMCATYSMSRKTRRWPCCLFYGILNVATINSFILYKLSGHATGSKRNERRLFMQDLAYEFTRPYAIQRLEVPTLSRSLKTLIRDCYNVPEHLPPPPNPQPAVSRQRCNICHWKTASKCKTRCLECNRPICPTHTRITCVECYRDNPQE